ncbi:MAG: right-handed parallel beta-helix repeat-containing protein [Eubacterium sp.]|nr:right-handed parallel beta-helix repeat-containing protein [Eubacterium sp.]
MRKMSSENKKTNTGSRMAGRFAVGGIIGALLLSVCAVSGVRVSLADSASGGAVSGAPLDLDLHPPKIDIHGPACRAIVTYEGEETEYVNANEAWDAISGKSGALMTLNADWERGSRLYADGSYDGVTLDLAGFTITRKTDGREGDGEVIWVGGGANFTIRDSNPNKHHFGLYGGTITGGNSSDGAGGIHINGGHLTMNGGMVYANKTNEHGAGIYIKEGGSLVMNGGSIRENRSEDAWGKTHGGGIYIEDGSCELNGVEIKENYSENSGGGIYFNKGSLKVNNCTIKSNYAREDGGGVAIDAEGAQFINSTIESNTAKEDGGGIWINDDRTNILGGTITDNTADNGGGVYVDSMNDVGIQGLLVIKWNHNYSGAGNNLCLQDGKASGARVYSGGLDPGSSVGIDKTGGLSSGGYKALIGVTQYQLENYFVADRGSFTMKDAVEENVVYMATAVSEGSFAPYLVILLELIAGATVIIITIRRKQNKHVEEEQK